MSNEIQKTETAAVGLPLEPRTAEEASRLAVMMAKSNLVPEAYRNKPENIFIAMMMGRDLGLSTMQAMRGIYVVNGTPAVSAMTLVGLVRRSNECLLWQMVESTPEQATFITQRRGDPEPTRFTYTLKDAEQAGLLPAKGDSNWAKRPRTMLRHRAESELARTVYPDIVQGLYTEDEVSEIGPRNMGELTRVENVRPLQVQALPEPAPRETIEVTTREAEPVHVEKPAEKPATKVLIQDESTTPDRPAEPPPAFPEWALVKLGEWGAADEKMPKSTYDQLVVEIQRLPKGKERAELGKRLLKLGHAPETTTQREPGSEG